MALLGAAFQSQVGLENEVLELSKGGYAWFDVLGVTEEKQKPFETVKDEVKTLTIANERTRLVAEALANKLVERADKGETMAALAKEAGDVKVETTPPFTRTTEPQGLTKDAIARAFTLVKGKAGSASRSTTRRAPSSR